MKKFVVIALFFLLFYTRFVGLDWGFPYPMHPDERNMAVAIEQLTCNPQSLSHFQLNECLNPHFFAYGQFPLYLAYGGVQLYHVLTSRVGQPNFLEATLALRAISAFSSILTVFILLKIIKLLLPIKNVTRYTLHVTSLIFFIFQPYAIQFAHFGTTESLLMLFYSLIIYHSLILLSNLKAFRPSNLLLLGLFSGLALGTKTSSLLFLGIPILTLFLKAFSQMCTIGGADGGAPRHARISILWRSTGGEEGRGRIYRETINLFIFLLIYLSITLLFFILSSPQSLLNWNDFVGSMNYESAVGLGTYVPFYTRQFVGTTPILFQFQKILPYILGWPQFILSISGFFLLPSFIGSVMMNFMLQVARVKGTQQRAQNFKPAGNLKVLEHWWEKLRVTESAKFIDILRLALLLSFLPSSFFFAKWTRFIAPSFPLFSLFAILFCMYIFKNATRYTSHVAKYFVLLIIIIPGVAYLFIYLSPDVRFTASDWIYKNIPANSKILSETANVIDIPISSLYSKEKTKNYLINSFNFYDLDVTQQLQIDLSRALKDADYIIVPSRRIFKNHPKTTYPSLANYYDQLFSGLSGFEKVAEFSSYPRFELFGKTLFSFPDEEAEETWTVFDHPVIRIYKKVTTAELPPLNQLDFTHYQTTSYKIGDKNYKLLIADTLQKWEKGLMYVKKKEDINNLDGMIFTFSDSQIRMFWNKNTLSHLTLYWINNGKVLGASDLPSITETGVITTVSSPSSADTVIEIIQ